MRPWLSLLCVALSIRSSLAVYRDDAYHVDYHYALLGLPQQDTTFFQQPYSGSKASLIFSISDKNILGAVNPKDGTLLWRQQLVSPHPGRAMLRSGEDQDSVISGFGGSLSAWGSTDGKLIWSKSYTAGQIQDLEILELGTTAASVSKDALVLLNSSVPTIERLDGRTGEVKWRFEDTSGDTPYQVSASATDIYLISLHSTILGNIKFKVTSLDLLTGRKTDQYSLSSDTELASTDSVLFVGANSASPLLVWTDKANTVLKVNVLGSKTISTIKIDNKGEPLERVTVHAPHRIHSAPHFLVHFETGTTHWAIVYHVDLKSASVSEAYSLPKQAGRGTFSTSTADANVYFTRVTSEEVTVVSSASHAVLGRWPAKLSDKSLIGSYPVHGISEVVVRSGSAQAVRTAVLYSSGSWALVRNGDLAWTRPEVLSGAVSAVFADLPEEASIVHELEVEVHQNALAAYIHRVKRHIGDLENLPGWLQNLPGRIIKNFIGSSSYEITGDLKKDSFGFRQLVVLATASGRLVGLDAANAGKLLWNVDFAHLIPGVEPKSVSLRSLPGGIIQISSLKLDRPLLFDVVTGSVIDKPAVQEVKAPISPDELSVITKLSYEVIDGEVKGFIVGEEASGPVWVFTPPPGERIINLTARPKSDPVASLGKVLGDRKVLYKYLNPNLVLITTIVDDALTASVYLLDSASGNVLHSATHDNVDVSRPITSLVSENWIAYSFTGGNSPVSPFRGYELVVAELYESSLPNDRGPLGAAANFSAVLSPSNGGGYSKPHVKSQSFLISHEIAHMGVTQTRQGITTRDLLVSLPQSNAIVGIPRFALDARRPVGRDPTSQEAMEGLTRYTPSLELDPKWYLSHQREVMDIKAIITSPALLESTSLVLAYGHDVFGTRVSPSFSFDILGKDFNKIQMLTTVVALGLGVLFVAPLVLRKQINLMWQPV